MRRILVGIDGSSHAKEAARVAVGLAKRLGDSVTLAYVVPPTPVELAISVLVDVHRDLREQNRYAEEMLRRLAAEIRDPAVAVDIHVCEGEAAAQLAELAREKDTELVVVGSHGMSALARALLGSVTTHLTRICPKPMIVVPPIGRLELGTAVVAEGLPAGA